MGETELDGFFLKASSKLNERWEWERHNGCQTMHRLRVYFLPLANEVTFIQSQIISFPFSLLAERKNPYREVKRGAVSLFAIFNLVCVEGNTRTIKIQTIWDRGDNPPALLSEVCGRHRRGVSRDYERKWCLNGSLSDLFFYTVVATTNQGAILKVSQPKMT